MSVAYMEFKNDGEIPINAFKLLGASTKREDDSKIGFFGTGLKYSIAMMLRNNIDFKVFVGEKEVKFGIVKTKFGSLTVNVISVNREKTSLTTDAGIDWEPWFAIREIYSNTLDEGGSIELQTDFIPESGKTKIYVEMSNKLGDVSSNWQEYFSMKRDHLSSVDGNRILEKKDGLFDSSGFTVFRKGIRVHKEMQESLFDYDVDSIEINESRVVKHPWESCQRAAETLAKTDNIDIIKKFISKWMHDTNIEHHARFWTYLFDNSAGDKFSQTWFEALKDYRIVPRDMTGFYEVTANTIGLPERLIQYLYNQFGDTLNLVGLSKEQYIVVGDFPEKLEESYNFLEKNGYTFPKESIKIGKMKDNGIEGLWDKKNELIVVNIEALNQHPKALSLILLEEICHQRSGYTDNTRQFQDYIFGELYEKLEK